MVNFLNIIFIKIGEKYGIIKNGFTIFRKIQDIVNT